MSSDPYDPEKDLRELLIVLADCNGLLTPDDAHLEPIIDCTIPDNSDDPAFWTYCFMKQYEARFIDATIMMDWFTRCLRAGRRQAEITQEVSQW